MANFRGEDEEEEEDPKCDAGKGETGDEVFFEATRYLFARLQIHSFIASLTGCKPRRYPPPRALRSEVFEQVDDSAPDNSCGGTIDAATLLVTVVAVPSALVVSAPSRRLLWLPLMRLAVYKYASKSLELELSLHAPRAYKILEHTSCLDGLQVC